MSSLFPRKLHPFYILQAFRLTRFPPLVSVPFLIFPELCFVCYCSVTKSCPTLCNPMDCSMSGFLSYLLEFAQTHVHWVGDAIQPSHPVTSFSACPQSFPASGSFPMSWLFASGAQSIGASASASVLPMNIQGWFPLGLTDLISLLSTGLSRVFSILVNPKFLFLLGFCYLVYKRLCHWSSM